MANNSKIIFWGTSEFSICVLEELKKKNILPYLIITVPDKPKGRKLIMTPPPVKIWAQKNNIKFIQPEILNIENYNLGLRTYNLQKDSFDLFIVVAYGKIIPKEILEIPKHGTINIHPSLLPKLRGASPIQTAILEGLKETGTTIMLLDEEMDHGPIIRQEKIKLDKNIISTELEKKLAEESGKLLAEVIPKWISKKIKTKEQDHSKATFTKKIKKEDGLINLEKDDDEIIYRKFRAFQPWPGTYFIKDGKRIIIKSAKLENSKFIIEKVIPEGKKEIAYQDFLKEN